jgi:hypothetical protein
MLSSAWPRRLTTNKQTLVIAPTKASADRGLHLEPITIPLADIMTETERRISHVCKTYREKRRGRPAGWSKGMIGGLSEVSVYLQDVDDEQIRRSIAAHRAGNVEAPEGIKETDSEA